jgi:hypothetical protein
VGGIVASTTGNANFVIKMSNDMRAAVAGACLCSGTKVRPGDALKCAAISEPIGLPVLLKGGLLLGHAVERAEAKNHIAAGDADYFAVGEQTSEGIQG